LKISKRKIQEAKAAFSSQANKPKKLEPLV